MCMTLTLLQGNLAFVGKKAYLSQQVKKKPSKGNIALALVSLVSFFFFFVRFWFYQLVKCVHETLIITACYGDMTI